MPRFARGGVVPDSGDDRVPVLLDDGHIINLHQAEAVLGDADRDHIRYVWAELLRRRGIQLLIAEAWAEVGREADRMEWRFDLSRTRYWRGRDAAL